MSFEIVLPLSPRAIMLSIVGILLLINYAYFLPKSIKCIKMYPTSYDDSNAQGWIPIIHMILSGVLFILLLPISLIYISKVIFQNTWLPGGSW